MELRKEGAGVGDSLTLQHLRHQRRRRGRDGAAAPLKADIGDAVAIEGQVHRHPVTAERVVALREMRRMIDLSKIPRMASVIENDVLIKLAQIDHRTNISRAASIAVTNRSMSLSSL